VSIRSLPPRPRALAVGALATAWALAAPVAHAQLARGDLLVTDYNNARVLRVTSAGQVTDFSPRAGSGPNLLVNPAGIGVTPDQRVLVADAGTDRVVEIDPATGVQSIARTLLYDGLTLTPGSLGTGLYGLDVDDFGEVWVTASGSHQLFRALLLGDGTLIASPIMLDVGSVGPLGLGAIEYQLVPLVFLANGSLGQSLVDTLNGPESSPLGTLGSGGQVMDAEALFASTAVLVVLVQQVPGTAFGCDPTASGVYAEVYPIASPSSLSLGGLLRCPFAVAGLGPADPSDTPFFVSDAAQTIGGDARIVTVRFPSGAQTLLASLPAGSAPTLPAGLVVVPEPGAAASSAAAAVSLAALLAARRRATRPGAHTVAGNRPQCSPGRDASPEP
jgi:hypothetical protein